MGETRVTHRASVEKTARKRPLGKNTGVDGKIMLKWM
jgi:hypothetical protein